MGHVSNLPSCKVRATAVRAAVAAAVAATTYLLHLATVKEHSSGSVEF
jgi:hypothetical protein